MKTFIEEGREMVKKHAEELAKDHSKRLAESRILEIEGMLRMLDKHLVGIIAFDEQEDLDYIIIKFRAFRCGWIDRNS